MNKPLVLDTNVVFDLWHFDDPVARPLRDALETSVAHCVVSTATLEEWRRVLAYPAFGLSVTRQSELLDTYVRLARTADSAMPGIPLPHCTDPDDQKFLELTAASGSCALISKDRALLRLRRRCAPHFHIFDPAQAVAWLAAPES